jgi:hypothetical protein
MSPRNVTERLARPSARHRRRVLAAWMLAVVASAAAIGGLLGSALTDDDDFTGRCVPIRASASTRR